MSDVAIGLSIHNLAMTVVVRRRNTLAEPVVLRFRDAQEAAAMLLELIATEHRHDEPTLYFEGGPWTDDIVREIHKENNRLPLHTEVIEGTAPTGARFENLRSALHYALRQAVEEGRLRVPPSYHDDLAAFEFDDAGGKVRVESPDRVAEKLSRYPARAVAAVLAAQQARGQGGVGRCVVEDLNAE